MAMSKLEYISLLKRELLWHDDFLVQFKDELAQLYSDPTFLTIIDEIHKIIGPNEFDDIDKSKEIIKKEMWDRKLFFDFPVFKAITDSVKGRGNAGTSASISVYMAMRIFEVSNQVRDVQNIPHKNSMWAEMDFRQQFKAEYRCDDGHYVRSTGELLIDNWLYSHNIAHAYEIAIHGIGDEEKFVCNFYIPKKKLCIEFWGLSSREFPEHLEKMARKKGFYRMNKFNILDIAQIDLMHIDEKLKKCF